MSLPGLLRTAALLMTLLPLAAAAAPIGTVTIVDGGALSLIRETQRLAAPEGLRVQAEDIVRSGEATRLARLELADGTTLDLGPSTELLLRPAGAAHASTLLYLLRGWLKVGGGEAAGGIGTPRGEVTSIAGQAVVRVAPQALLVFAETGRVELAPAQTLREGDAWVQRDGEPGRALRRPPADLMDGLPRGFVDPLPLRRGRFEKTSVEPGRGAEVSYAEVAPWLTLQAPLRTGLLPRFAPRARDREFRAGLVADLRAHPEWDRTLFPEKYRPRPAPAPRPPAPAPAPAAPPVTVDLQGLMSWPAANRPAAPALANPPPEAP